MTTIFSDNTFRHFFSPVHLREETIQTFQGKAFALNKEDPCYEARKEYYENQRNEELDPVESFKKNRRSRKKKSRY